MEEASFLSKFAVKVVMVHRQDKFNASKIMTERVFNNSKIEILWNTELKQINGSTEAGVSSVNLFNNKTQEYTNFPTEGVFIAIGHKPNTSLFEGVLNMDNFGYLVTEKSTMKTNIEGVFACGDVQDSSYRQAITAAGSGCMAAIDAERYLASISETKVNTATNY